MSRRELKFVILGLGALLPGIAIAAPAAGLDLFGDQPQRVSEILRVFLFLSALSFLPALAIALTSFTRNIVVLSLLRQALGLQQTPPNSVLITLAIFLTLFTMLPTFTAMHEQAIEPWSNDQITAEQALERGFEPIRTFMIRQTRASDLDVILNIAAAEKPESTDDIKPMHLIPAFMLSELKTAFQIGFVIFLPFLMIDLVVAAILMSLGMIMVPPIAISLPIKIMIFVLIDGWTLVVQSLLSSFMV